MNPYRVEQRTKRSDIAQEALQLQLQATAERAKFSSLVLADELGLIMACAGDAVFSEDLAAMSPKLVQDSPNWQGKVFTQSGRRIKVIVSTVHSDSGSFYLCATGELDATALAELASSGRGVHRILA